MALVKLPVRCGRKDRFILVDPNDVSMIMSSGDENKYCWLSVKGSYGTADCDGAVEVDLTAEKVAAKLGKSITEKVEW